MNSKYGLFTIILLIFFATACEKEEEDEPCIGLPCGNTEEYYGNRVARDSLFRQGTWVNIDIGRIPPDTIIFHENGLYSNYNHLPGFHEVKYRFWHVYLEILQDPLGNDLNIPIKYETRYNDTTGIFSIVRQATPIIGGGTDFEIVHYVKIE